MEQNTVDQIIAGLTEQSQDLSGHSGALAQSITLVDQQVQTILNIPDAPPDLPHSKEVNQSLSNYRSAVQGWQQVKGNLIATLELIGGLGSGAGYIADIPDFLLTVETIQGGLKVVKAATDLLAGRLQECLTAIQTLEETVDASYRENARALTTSSDEINRQNEQLQNSINSLNYKINDFMSARSVVLGVVTAGIYSAVKINEIKNDLKSCKDKQQRLYYYKTLYDQVNSMVLACRGAMRTTSLSLENVNSTVQQSLNQLKGMQSSDSSSLVVMKAYLKTIQKQAAAATEKINDALK